MAQVVINTHVKLGEGTLDRSAISSILPSGFSGNDSIGDAKASVNGKNMNTITEAGTYYGYNMTNAAETTISTFTVTKYSNDWIAQTQQVITSQYTKIYTRTFRSGTTWTPWVRVPLEGPVVVRTIAPGGAFNIGTTIYAKVTVWVITTSVPYVSSLTIPKELGDKWAQLEVANSIVYIRILNNGIMEVSPSSASTASVSMYQIVY